MDNSKPLIHLMKTPYNFYFFDVNTNQIVKINQDIFEYLENEQKDSISEFQKSNKDLINRINCLKEEGLLSSNRVKRIIHKLDSELNFWLENKVTSITLQITQQCNLRCSYCPYCENNSQTQRNHSTQKMSFETIKKAINFLLEHSSDTINVNIGFYGGEPLLEFELIKRSIEYAEEVLEGKKINYHITTNGTLLSNTIIEYFMKHNVHIMISFDGPKEIHDKQRKFESNNGSFDIIDSKLQEIKKNYFEYFKTFDFNVVIDPQNDFNCINEFLVNYNVFRETHVRTTLIDDSYLNQRLSFTNNYITKNKYEIFKMFLHYFGRLDNQSISPSSKIKWSQIITKRKELKGQVKLLDQMSPSGPCIPGVFRLFIDSNGNFFPCERVSELSSIMKIGCIDTGFDIDKIRKLLNVGMINESECKNCWVIQHCKMCAKLADDLKDLSVDKLKGYCVNICSDIESIFKHIIAVKEIEALFADHINEEKNQYEKLY